MFMPTRAREIFRVEGLQIGLAFTHTDDNAPAGPNGAASATRMPPLAVPSSLVMIRPVSGTAAVKASTW